MDLNNPHNQSYWFVLREDQSNVIFSSNNFTIQNPPRQETRYIVDAVDNRQYSQINDASIVVQEDNPNISEKEATKTKEDDNIWDRSKIKLLLTLCLESKIKIVSKDKSIWNEISLHLDTTPEECCKKYNNLRRTYIRLLKKKRLGKDIKWVHYNICEEVFKECSSLPSSVLEVWEDHKVRRLLELYLENIHKFRNRDCLQKDIWRDIAIQLGTTEYNCYHKFKNLKSTYFKWLGRNRDTGKVSKWPYHHHFERIFDNYHPSVGPWDRNKIRSLLNAYAQIAHKFKYPRYQKKELWKEISILVGESPSSCDKKFRNLKQTYIRLKMKANSGICITRWRYFKDFETIYNSASIYSSGDDGGQEVAMYRPQEEDYAKELLQFYLENKDKFKDPLVKKKPVWRLFGSKIGLSSEQCDRKFRNLKQTYLRLLEKKKETGKCNKWPYYSYFEQIFDEPRSSSSTCHVINNDVDSMKITDIRKVMQNLQDTKNSDKFEQLIRVIEESNNIQRERNKILQALLDKN